MSLTRLSPASLVTWPLRVWHWFQNPIRTEIEAEKILKGVWTFYIAVLCLLVFGYATLLIWAKQKGYPLTPRSPSIIRLALAFFIVHLIRTRKSRALAVFGLLFYVTNLIMLLPKLWALRVLTFREMLLLFDSRVVLQPVVVMVIASIMGAVMYNGVRATFAYHSILRSKTIWKHVAIVGSAFPTVFLLISLLEFTLWQVLTPWLSLPPIPSELLLINVMVTIFVSNHFLLSRFPLTQPARAETTA